MTRSPRDKGSVLDVASGAQFMHDFNSKSTVSPVDCSDSSVCPSLGRGDPCSKSTSPIDSLCDFPLTISVEKLTARGKRSPLAQVRTSQPLATQGLEACTSKLFRRSAAASLVALSSRLSDGPRKWIADTGASLDIAPSHAFSERLLKQMRPATNPIKLETVNGTVTIDESLLFTFRRSADRSKLQ